MIVDSVELASVLERATGVRASEHDGGLLTVQFEHGVETAQRVTMWAEPAAVVLATWVAELKPQYEKFYGDTAAIEATAALEHFGWVLRSNFHLAFHNAHWKQRYYPGNRMPAAQYMRQWAVDLPNAGRFPTGDVEDPNFARWLVERGYITEPESDTLAEWVRGLTRQYVDVRPSVAIERSWDRLPTADEVRDAVNEVLTALNEPLLTDSPPPLAVAATRVGGAKAAGRPAAKAPVKKKPVPVTERPLVMCPNCFVALPANGECDCG